MKKAFPEDYVFLIGDQPGYAGRSRAEAGQKTDITAEMQVDYLVIQGPFIRDDFDNILMPTLTGNPRFRFKVDLIRLWIERTRPVVAV